MYAEVEAMAIEQERLAAVMVTEVVNAEKRSQALRLFAQPLVTEHNQQTNLSRQLHLNIFPLIEDVRKMVELVEGSAKIFDDLRRRNESLKVAGHKLSTNDPLSE